MPINDWDGTTTHYNHKKAVDWNGTDSTVLAKGWDWNGTDSTLFYTSEYDVLAEGSWTKAGTTSYITTLSSTNVTIKITASGYGARIYKKIDVTNFTKMTITRNFKAIHAYLNAGLYKTVPGNVCSTKPDVGSYALDGSGVTQEVNGTQTYDISNLTGEYYAVIAAYRGSTTQPTCVVTQFILE